MFFFYSRYPDQEISPKVVKKGDLEVSVQSTCRILISTTHAFALMTLIGST